MPAMIGNGLFLLMGSGPELVLPTVAPYRDADIYDDIEARIDALGVFDEVHDTEDDRGPAAASERTMCRVIPGEAEDNTQFAPSVLLREGHYQIIIEVRMQDPRERRRKLDQLANQVKAALNQQSLADITFPDLTLIARDGPGRQTHPMRSITLNGKWTYLVPGLTGFSTND